MQSRVNLRINQYTRLGFALEPFMNLAQRNFVNCNVFVRYTVARADATQFCHPKHRHGFRGSPTGGGEMRRRCVDWPERLRQTIQLNPLERLPAGMCCRETS